MEVIKTIFEEKTLSGNSTYYGLAKYEVFNFLGIKVYKYRYLSSYTEKDGIHYMFGDEDRYAHRFSSIEDCKLVLDVHTEKYNKTVVVSTKQVYP